MEKTDAVAALAALAQDNRLDVFRLLVQAGPEGIPAGEIAKALKLAPNTLNFHFDRLRAAGLVTVRRNLAARRSRAARAGGLQTGTDEARKDADGLRRSSTMKRMHVHVAVADIPHAVEFYAAMFDARQVVVKPDYAKWMLEDPRVNFAISTRGKQPGLDHLGIQVEDQAEAAEGRSRTSLGWSVVMMTNTPGAMPRA